MLAAVLTFCGTLLDASDKAVREQESSHLAPRLWWGTQTLTLEPK